MPNYPYSFQLPPLNVQDIPSNGVAGEFLGISAGGVLDWLPVSGGSGTGDLLAANNLSELTPTAGTARTNLGLGTSDSPTFANLTLTSPSLASSAPVTISQTWNQIGTAFTALKVNAVSTASATGSLLLDLQLGGATKFKVDKASVATLGVSAGADNSALYFGGANYSISLTRHATGLDMGVGGDNRISFGLGVGQILLSGRSSLAWSDGNVTNTGTVDTILLRDGAANTLALRNGANTQTFNVYGSYGSISDYKRLSISCDQTTGNATITNQAAGYTAGTVSINGVPVGLGKGNVSTNVAVGFQALNVNTSGDNNTGVGVYALLSNTTGFWNTGFGSGALYSNTTGANNTAVGIGSIQMNTTGSGNTALGKFAGSAAVSGNNVLCNNSVFIGADTKVNATSETNQIVIGYQAIGIGSNSVVLGNDSITKTALKGNVGIGTTAPSEKLHVLGGKVLFGDPSDPTGTAGNGELTLHARTLPQLNMVSNVGVNSFFGLSLKAGTTERAGFLVNMQSGEVKMGALSGAGYFPTFWSNGVEIMRFSTGGNVGIGTTSPSSKLHVAGSSSPSITVDNTLATGASQLLFKNTVVTGDTDGIFLNGSAQSGFGGNGSLNIKATTGPLAFHTASVTNALSIAQNGAITCSQSITSQSSISANTNAYIMWGGGNSSRMLAPSDGIIQFTDAATTGFNRLQFGGTTNLFPAIKRSAVRIQAVLANDTGFTNIQGKLTTDTDYTATVVTPTGFLTLYDAQGTAYRVPCVAAP